METNKILLYGGLGVGAYLLYRHYKTQQATAAASAAAAAATPATPSTLTNPVNIPQSGVIAPPGSTLPNVPLFSQVVSQLQPSSPVSSASIDPTVASVVQKWATADGRPPVLQMASAMVPAEYQGMYNIITNFWDRNVSPDAAATQFWNDLRDKYDPTHQSW